MRGVAAMPGTENQPWLAQKGGTVRAQTAKNPAGAGLFSSNPDQYKERVTLHLSFC